MDHDDHTARLARHPLNVFWLQNNVSEKCQPYRVRVDHHPAAYDGVAAGELEQVVADFKDRVPVLVPFDVAQVPHVANFVVREAVVHVAGVVVTAGGLALVGEVAKRVDVKAVLARREAGDVADHGDGAAGVGLREGDGAGDQGLPHTRPLFSST
jgi:hypothetical protein